MAITTYDQLVAAIAGSPNVDIWKPGGSSLAEAAGEFSSLWTVAGRPSAAAAPSMGLAGAALDRTAAGALPFTNPAGTNTKYLAASSGTITTAGTAFLCDRLWHNSGIAVATTTLQSWVPAGAAARDANGTANGEGVEAWLEVYTATTNAGAITGATISYTNQAGVAGRTGTIQTIPATAVAGTMVPILLQSGDTGVRSIEGITLGTSLVTGAVGLVLLRRVAMLPLPLANAGYAMGWDVLGQRLQPDSCLFLALLNTSTTRGNLMLSLCMIEG